MAGKSDKNITEIRKLLKSKSLIIGTKETLKALKLGKLKKVFLSANPSESTVESINRYARSSNIEVIKLRYPNDELGILCKKPFSISVLGVK